MALLPAVAGQVLVRESIPVLASAQVDLALAAVEPAIRQQWRQPRLGLRFGPEALPPAALAPTGLTLPGTVQGLEERKVPPNSTCIRRRMPHG